jgi:hypothetical protein
VGSIAYALAFFLSGGVNARDRQRLKEAIEMLRSWQRRRGTSRLSQVEPGLEVGDGAVSAHRPPPEVAHHGLDVVPSE